MPRILCFVGRSGSGKTTLLEKLIRELTDRGVRVAAIKHDAHRFDIDRPGKDSWRLAQAGSSAVVISSPKKYALVHSVERERTLEELAGLVHDVDLILAEGYRAGTYPKVEIVRSQRSTELLCRREELAAIVSDRRFPLPVPQFGLEEVGPLADFVLDYAGLSGEGLAEGPPGAGP